MIEFQYAACFDEPPVMLGPMTGSGYRWDPRRLGITLARYKFVAKMLSGCHNVAEIGCGDGFAAPVVQQEVQSLTLFDFDPAFGQNVHDITCSPLSSLYHAIYLLDVLEHIHPDREDRAMANIVDSLAPDGICIIGMPSLESQDYASEISKAGHVNCKTGPELRRLAKRYFRNVFLFGMSDEVVHTGFDPMCHYRLVLCTGPIDVFLRT